jgi:beta-mannanase
VPWAAIARGAQDAWIVERADAFRAFGHPIMLIFHHEPAAPKFKAGTPADFVAAWRHIHDLFVQRGARNVVWVLTLNSYTIENGDADDYYPGDPYVDWVSADGYNWFGPSCKGRPWRSFAEIFAPLQSWGHARGKPVMVAEFGSVEDPAVPGRKAQWLADALATVRDWDNVRAILYFDARVIEPVSCDWRIGTSPASVDGFRRMAADPHLNPSG